MGSGEGSGMGGGGWALDLVTWAPALEWALEKAWALVRDPAWALVRNPAWAGVMEWEVDTEWEVDMAWAWAPVWAWAMVAWEWTWTTCNGPRGAAVTASTRRGTLGMTECTALLAPSTASRCA